MSNRTRSRRLSAQAEQLKELLGKAIVADPANRPQILGEVLELCRNWVEDVIDPLDPSTAFSFCDYVAGCALEVMEFTPEQATDLVFWMVVYEREHRFVSDDEDDPGTDDDEELPLGDDPHGRDSREFAEFLVEDYGVDATPYFWR